MLFLLLLFDDLGEIVLALDVLAEERSDGFGSLELLELLGADPFVVVERAAVLGADGQGVGGRVVADFGNLRA